MVACQTTKMYECFLICIVNIINNYVVQFNKTLFVIVILSTIVLFNTSAEYTENANIAKMK